MESDRFPGARTAAGLRHEAPAGPSGSSRGAAAMPTVRERVSDTLLRVGTDIAVDRAALVRRLAATPAAAPGRDAALAAMALAARVDAALIWLAWRLRPSRVAL